MFTYDLSGNPTQRQDRESKTTTRAYDPLNRLSTITYSDGSTLTYGYNQVGDVTSVDDSLDGLTTRVFDIFGHIESETGPRGSIAYTYDADDQRLTAAVSGQPQTTYEYDAAHRLTQVTQDGRSAQLTLDDLGRRTGLSLTGGVSVSYVYDSAGQLTSMLYANATGQIGSLAGLGAVAISAGLWRRRSV
jgi:YD repeat-containing protein